MSERGRYRTKQQEIILNCLKKQESRFLTVEQFMDRLREEGVMWGRQPYTGAWSVWPRMGK